MTDNVPRPRYTIWQAISAALGLSTRAIEEVRALAARPARIARVIEWQEGVHYAGTIVTHLGQTWQAQRDTGRSPPHEDWICVAAAGRDGRSFTIRNGWSASETYRALDVVALDGASWVARIDEPGPCPGEGWQLIAKQGHSGKPGQRGERGQTGPAGRSFVAASIDAEGMLTFTADDGSVVVCDLYPALSRAMR